ncbi:uncharacterized protein [Aegilops tauschii subsp. strangulata]|uniref:uncharacterized protein n=1 Tax=Aegilops tauschii subsp. strangulata TaxID=200361 RepID=UPI003CC8DC87
MVGQNGNQNGHHSKLLDFQRTKPPSFSQVIDPLEADDLLRTIEKKLEIARTKEADKVPFATHYLEGSATIWWDNAKAMWPADDEITWGKFKDHFCKYHIPAGILKIKQREFLALTQGSLSVSEYLHKFTHLARYSLYDVVTEERKIYRFLGGRNQHLRCTLSMFGFPDFQTLVNKALIAKREDKLVHDNKPANNDHKRNFEPKKDGQPVQKTRTWQQSQVEFKPNWQQNVNNTTTQVKNIVTSPSFAAQNKFSCSIVEMTMMVQSPGSLLKSNLASRNLEIDIKGAMFPASLIGIESTKLDIILGMNWLTKHQVCINYVTREVTFTSQEGQTAKFVARRSMPKKEMVFAAITEELDLIPVVSEFPDVFPKELPGMPPDQELEFAINLVPGTALLYKKYYRIPSSELVELKKQLDEMLQKGYIRPSSSP